ncbi:unnamed protein product, partial [Nesidiocoris tenuis]
MSFSGISIGSPGKFEFVYRRRSGETSYLHFVKTATIPMVPYVTTLNFHDISNVHVQVRNWRYEISPLRRRYLCQ